MVSQNPPELALRLLTKKGDWTVKTLLQAVFWVRIFIGVFIGTFLGIFKVTGMVGNLTYLLVGSFGVQTYVSNTVDEDIVNNPKAQGLLMEGLMQGFAAMLLVWITLYSIQTM